MHTGGTLIASHQTFKPCIQLLKLLVPKAVKVLIFRISPYSSRKNNQQFFYTKHEKYGDPGQIIKFRQPYIYKYWDEAAESTGKSGANFSLIRYARVLLDCAEAKTQADGGQTSDPAAINAYYLVHHRAVSDYHKPGSISFNEVYKERFWELCFEFKTWYDMVRTRKAFDVVNNKVVNLIGYKAPTHLESFQEKDLLFQIPFNEIQLSKRFYNIFGDYTISATHVLLT